MMHAVNEREQTLAVHADPKVSVIVPVYNVAEYLPQCLDSLVFQTLQDIEIIVVNDGSPDNSQDIIDQYAQQFPQMIRPFIKENGGLSSARKYGFERARADYVMFVDSDDYVDYHTCEWLWTKAMEENSDIVYAPGYTFDEGNGTYDHFGKLPPNISKEEFLVKGKATFNGVLMRVDYVKGFALFEDMTYEDAATTMAVYSYTNKISYIDRPCYAYVINRPGSITANKKKASIVDTIKADELVWTKANPAYYPYLAARLFNRICANARNAYIIYDQIVMHAKAFAYRLYPNEKELKKYCSESNRKQFDQLCLEPDEMMPTVIFLNGFDPNMDRDAYLAHVGMAFIGDQELVWLDETSCSVQDMPKTIRECLDSGDYERVGVWAALRKIHEHGGVYVGPDIRVLGTFNRMRFKRAFFGFLDRTTINVHVFGGQAQQDIFSVLERLVARPGVENPEQAFAMGLCGHEGLHLTGKEQLSGNGVALYENYVFSFSCEAYQSRNISAYLPQLASADAYMAFFKHGYDTVMNEMQASSSKAARSMREDTSSGKSGSLSLTEAEKLKKKAMNAQKEVEAMKNTLSWRITKPLRAVRSLIGKREH